MTKWNPKANEIFADAMQVSDDGERDELVTSRCGEDDELRRDVEAMLDIEAPTDDFLANENADSSSWFDQESELVEIGATIDGYQLLQKIGEGGFGIVFMAEQRAPMRRKVALKIIKAGMDSKEVVARFEAERQALAMMDHPNIAKILDAGTTKNGRPYFVMELVHGVPITAFCEQNRLAIKDRLRLFDAVCHAIQHAHVKAIIHRDIKPSNVLVTMHDDVPVPKVIDFGVAKCLQTELTQRTLFTQYGQLLGTPSYMSPEQAQFSGIDVDTRCDIYTLGVLLYQLLTGTTPLSHQDLLDAGFDEVCRKIREDAPMRPSNRLSTLKNERRVSMARSVGVSEGDLFKFIRGDLDWIVMKALEKNRARRYQTAAEFAADIQRFLHGAPIEARPASVAYRFSRLIRRNRVAAIASAAVASILLVAIVGISLAWSRATADRQELGDYLFHESIVAAVNGEDSRATMLVDKVHVQESRARREFILGLLASADGDLNVSRDHLKKSISLNRDFLPAWLELTSVYQKIDWWAMDELRRREDLPPPRTAIDRLFLAKSSYPKESLDVLDKHPELLRDYPFARLIRAEKLAEWAMFQREGALAEEAKREFERAELLLGQGRFPRARMRVLDSIIFLSRQQTGAYREDLLAISNQCAERIAVSNQPSDQFAAAVHYEAIADDHVRARLAWDNVLTPDVDVGLRGLCALVKLRDIGVEDALEICFGDRGNQRMCWEAILLATLPDGKAKARKILADKGYPPSGESFLIFVPAILGDHALLQRTAREWAKQARSEGRPARARLFEYSAGLISEQAYQTANGGSGNSLHIAIKALIDGDSEKSKEVFQDYLDNRSYPQDYARFIAESFLAQIARDEKWLVRR